MSGVNRCSNFKFILSPLIRCRASLGVSGSFGVGWLGILHLWLNLPEFVARNLFIFKAYRRLFGTVASRGQGQCPTVNLEEGDDHFADGITTLRWRIIFDCGV